MTSPTDTFTWRFLDEVAYWALGMAAVAALMGAIVTRSWAFPVSCLVTAFIDVCIVHASAHRGGNRAEEGAVDGASMVLFVGGRLAFKVVLLSAALLWPSFVDFWGVVAGAVAYDLTLVTIGSALATSRMRTAGR